MRANTIAGVTAKSPIEGSARDELPNIVLVMTDQQRADYLGCAGRPGLSTPNLDSLAATGTRFDRCYVASPVCMPNRASIMTGRMPSLHRVRMNGIPLPAHENTFVELLRLRGYSTALVGKSHLQNMVDATPHVARAAATVGAWQPPQDAREAVRLGIIHDYDQELPARWRGPAPLQIATPFYGFDHVRLVTGHGDLAGGHYYQWLRERHPDPERLRGQKHGLTHRYAAPQAWRTRMPEELYPTRYIEQESAAFIKRHAAERPGKPFFLAMSFPDPHHPFTPPGRYWDMYRPEDQALPTSFSCPDDVLPQVRWAREKRRLHPGAPGGYGAFAVNAREAREAAALTCGMVTMIDDAIGGMRTALRESGLGRDTLIIFTSDHGDFLGDHGLLLKGPVHLQSLIRVPLIWHDPTRPTAGVVSQALASSVDIAASILDRAGIEPYNGMQGRSLLGALDSPGSVAGGRDAVLIEEDAQEAHLGFTIAPRIRTLVTSRYRLSIYDRSGHGELFDLADDPDELRNRWHAADYAAIRGQLIEELALTEMEAADRSPMPRYLA